MKIKFNNIIKNREIPKDKLKKNLNKQNMYNNKISEDFIYDNIQNKVKKTNKINFNTNKKEESVESKKNCNANCKNINATPVFKVYKNDGDIIKYIPKITKENENSYNYKNNERNLTYKNEYEFKENKDKIQKNTDNDKKVPKSSLLLFILMIILAASSLIFAYKNYENLNQESYSVYSSIDNTQEVEESKNVEEQNSLANNKDTKLNQENEETSKKSETQNNTKNTTTKKTTKTPVPKVVPLDFARPLDGQILKIYSKDKVIYSKTLELWKTHEGIDIKADENTIVKSIEKGRIEKIYDDSFYGKTIVLDHGQGYKSSYSNLSEDVFVKEKQVVSKLTKIGKVGKTAIGEIKDETHLHFVLIKNNEITDPSSIFK